MANKWKLLPKETREARWQYTERLLAQGLSIGEVHRNVVSKFKRGMNWKTYKKMQQAVLADEATKHLEPEASTNAIVSLQPAKQVSNKLRLRLQGVVNEMKKGCIERLTVDVAGAVQVTFAPAEQIFDLEG